MLVDGVLAFFVALTGLGAGMREIRANSPLGVLVYIGMVVPLVFRRKHPVGMFVAVIAAGALEVVLFTHPIDSDVSVLVALYTLAAYRPRRISVPGLLVCLVGSAIAIATWQSGRHVRFSWFEFGAVTALFCGPALLAWLLGDSMRWRRGFYQALEERADRLEAERDAQAQVAVATERARIARELHDVVAHNVSVMVVQADGAAYALDSSPERTREALAAISLTGRQALAEMRHLLGVLRTASEEQAEFAPQPGLEQIADLLAHSRAAGLPVSFTVEGVARELPPGVALAAYRVVQESLTNTRKHAGPDATASVALRFCEDGMRIVVTDNGNGGAASSDGAGHGLVGMRERVEMYGGKVTTGPHRSGGYQVTATIPFKSRAAESQLPADAAPPGAAPENGSPEDPPGGMGGWEAPHEQGGSRGDGGASHPPRR
jgi:signal transduction histidine kinase